MSCTHQDYLTCLSCLPRSIQQMQAASLHPMTQEAIQGIQSRINQDMQALNTIQMQQARSGFEALSSPNGDLGHAYDMAVAELLCTSKRVKQYEAILAGYKEEERQGEAKKEACWEALVESRGMIDLSR